jgi:hypothetical protein
MPNLDIQRSVTFLYLEHPDRLCSSPSLLCSDLWGSLHSSELAKAQKTGSSSPYRAEVKNAWSLASTVPDAFLVCKGITWQLVKYVACMTAFRLTRVCALLQTL